MSLPGVLEIVAEEVGAEAAIKVGKRLAGCTHKFPAASTLDRIQRDEAIRREFKGNNINALAVKYGLTRRRIYQIVNDKG